MLDTLFSPAFFLVSVILVAASMASAWLCHLLHKELNYIALGEWLLDHVYCPSARILLLILMVYLQIPLIQSDLGYLTAAELFMQPDFLLDMVNILFLSSLIFSFLPLLNQLPIAMPILASLTTGLFFEWTLKLAPGTEFSWINSDIFIHLLILIIVLYVIQRVVNQHLSEWADDRFIISGSKELITDINSLIFQIPVVLVYGEHLMQQI